MVALFKPQFEVGKTEVGKGGIVRDPLVIEAALQRFRTWCAGNGYPVAGEAPSELSGAEGNQEFFFHLSAEVDRSASSVGRAPSSRWSTAPSTR